MKRLTYRGQTYTPSNQVDSVNTQMTLTYRGQSYQPCHSSLTMIPKAKLVYRGVPLKLIYRGQVFERIFRERPLPPQDFSSDMVKLIYRGQVHYHKPSDARPNIQSCHVNWRFRLG